MGRVEVFFSIGTTPPLNVFAYGAWRGFIRGCWPGGGYQNSLKSDVTPTIHPRALDAGCKKVSLFAAEKKGTTKGGGVLARSNPELLLKE